nr:hypothetical protein [Pseudomonas sp. PDM11]
MADELAFVAHAAAVQLQMTGAVGAAIGAHTGLDGTGIVQALGLHLDLLSGGEAFAHIYLFGLDTGSAAGVGIALEVDAVGNQGGITAGGAAVHGELAAGIDLDVTGGGRHIAGQVHADALLGTDQADRPGIHAAQGGAVDGDPRFFAAVIRLGLGLQGVDVHLVAPGHHVQALGVNIGVDLGGAGDQVELVDVAGVEASAFDGDIAALDVEAFETTILNFRLAGAQGRSRRVDEAAAIAGDAMWVGDDDVSTATSDLGVTLELTTVAAGHFIEDDARGATLEIRVALDVTA